MSARDRIVYMMVIAAILAAGIWFFTHFERVTEEREVGYRGEARFNQLLAARQFLQTDGTLARTVQRIDELPPVQGTLIIPTNRYEMSTAQAQALLRWVEQGGHAVVSPAARFGPRSRFGHDEDGEGESDAASDQLLAQLGVAVVHPKLNAAPVVPVDIDWPESKDFLQVDMPPYQRLRLTQAAALTLEDEHGIYLARYARGKGHVTVVASLQFLNNCSIGRYDHAAFLWHLAHFHDNGPVWLVFKDTMPGLPAWLAEHAWQAMVSAAVLLAMWLWHASVRFGPLLPVPALARRRLMEHIEASGRFLWHAGQAERLLKGVRQSLFRTLELRHPAWAGLPSAELYRRLGTVARLPAEEVQGALLYIHAGNEHEFTKVVSTLEHLRKSL